MDRRPKILVIDDDRSLCRLLRDYLRDNGYRAEAFSDPLAGLAAARRHKYVALVLDIMMPRLDGQELCERVREFSPLPVIMLSARDTPDDRIRSLELGADDHLGKPFEPRELLARLKAIIRRRESEPGAPTIKSAGIELELQRNMAYRTDNGKRTPIELSTVEFALLALLAKHRPEPVPRDDLYALVRGFERSYDGDRAIDILISRIRRKLKDNPQQPVYIKTVRNVGYAFIG